MSFFELMSKAKHVHDSVIAAIRGNGITAYWYRNEINFGDLITPYLLCHYGFTPVYDRPMRAQILATGSILEIPQNEYAGIILGSGFIEEASCKTFPKAKILAVRGKLTRERLGPGRETVALGDPGLLSSMLMPKRKKKRFMIGIIPHYVDKNNVAINRLAKLNRKDLTIIDVQQQPLKVFTKIDSCRYVLSSSLHGLIVADSLGIPNAWLAASGLKGGRFKFDDYYSAIGTQGGTPATLNGNETIDQLLALTNTKPAERIAQIKTSLNSLLCSLRQYM
jgi:pyruvyltransferase